LPERKYKWIKPEKLTPLAYKTREEYDECIEEFLESNIKSARVNISGVKPQSMHMLLLKRIRKRGLRDKIAVCIRKGKVYLVKLE
jgi:hypothetical protein